MANLMRKREIEKHSEIFTGDFDANFEQKENVIDLTKDENQLADLE